MAIQNLKKTMKLWHVQQCPFLSNLAPDELSAIYNRTEVVSLDKRNIVPLDTREESLWVIKRGHVTLSYLDEGGHESIVMILGPGDFFGSPINPEEWSSSMEYGELPRTLTSVCLCRFPQRSFTSLLEKYPKLSVSLNQASIHRIQRVQFRLADMLLRSVDKRLAMTLLELADICSVTMDDGSVMINFKLSHRELSQLAGSSREMISKVMKKFRDSGLVSMDRKLITIHRLDELKSFAKNR